MTSFWGPRQSLHSGLTVDTSWQSISQQRITWTRLLETEASVCHCTTLSYLQFLIRTTPCGSRQLLYTGLTVGTSCTAGMLGAAFAVEAHTHAA